jgi:hypothetical protein
VRREVILMSRINDDELRRLSAALATPDAHRNIVRHTATESQRTAVERLQAELSRRAGDEALGRALTQALAAYLNRPVRAVAGGVAGTIPGAWRYSAELGPISWWIEFDAQLAASLADAMLGGSGVGAKSGAGRRARSLVGKVADLFLQHLSSIVDAPTPNAAVWTDAATQSPGAQIAGRCVVNAEPHSWQAGVAASQESAVETIPAAAPPAHVAAPLIKHDPEVLTDIRTAIAAACAGLPAFSGGPVVVANSTITELDAPELPESAIRLALTTGGTGALVLCAQRDAVIAFASGAVGGKIPEADEIGSVVCAAAEAILREIIRGIASRLAAIAGVPQRTVYIAADAQLARTRHIAAAVTLHVAGSAANLRVLVPQWMIGPA